MSLPLTGVGGAAAPAAASAPAQQADPEAREAGEGFERMLLGQLTEALGAAARGRGGGAQDEMLPDALADAVIAHGGTGLAGQLYRALRVAEAR